MRIPTATTALLTWFGIGFLGAAVGSAVWSGEASQAAYPGANGLVAVADYSNPRTLYGNFIAAFNPRRSRSLVLSDCREGEPECQDGEPAWSPDGHHLAFTAEVNRAAQIALVGRDGARIRRLPPLTQDDKDPVWSPSGRFLAFVGDNAFDELPGNRADIYVVRADGSQLRQVTNDGAAEQPAWSSRGQLAFATLVGSRPEIFITRLGLRRQHRLTYRGGESPDWAPSGDKLLFLRDGHVYVTDVNGRRTHRLRQPYLASAPEWSPDGRSIIFGNGRGDIYTVDAGGRRVRRMLDGRFAHSPAWQPVPRTR